MTMIELYPNRCKEIVWGNSAWRSHQCSRNAWKDGYCKQHHPDTVKQREKAREERRQREQNNSPWR